MGNRPPNQPREYAWKTWPKGPFKASGRTDPRWLKPARELGAVVDVLVRRKKRMGMTTAALVEQSGVAKSTWRALVAGTTWPDYATLSQLARILEVKLSASAPREE